MANALAELVVFIGEEGALLERVKKAVEWVASKPEGQAILEEARALHGKPLTIITDSKIYNIGYGDHLGNHVVYANPNVLDKLQLHGENGEVIQHSLERFFPHEFKHAAQPNVLLHAQQYLARRQQIMLESMPPLPFEKYAHRIQATIHDDVALRDVLGEIYEEHIGPYVSQGMETITDRAAHDPIVQRFIDKYEIPAIEIENAMMQKYRGEAARVTGYAKSGIYEEYIQSMDRDGFIESALTSIRAQAPEKKVSASSKLRGGKRTDPKPRTGGWTEGN